MGRPRLLLLACLVSGLAVACQQATDAAGEAAIQRAGGQDVEVDRDGSRVRIRTADGEGRMQAGDALPLPADFPTDIWLPDRYAVNSVMDLGGMHVVSLNTPGKVAGVHARARQAMVDAGWTQTMSMQHSADNAMLAFEKDTRAAVLSFNKGEGGDSVVMSVQLRAQTP